LAVWEKIKKDLGAGTNRTGNKKLYKNQSQGEDHVKYLDRQEKPRHKPSAGTGKTEFKGQNSSTTLAT